jgi:hypothetical protein
MNDSMEVYYSLYNTSGNHFLNTSLDLFMECSIEVVSLEDSINYSIEIQYYNCIERSRNTSMDDSMELYYSLYNTSGNHFLNTSLDLFMESSIEVVFLEIP